MPSTMSYFYKLGRKCSKCEAPIIDASKTGICINCRYPSRKGTLAKKAKPLMNGSFTKHVPALPAKPVAKSAPLPLLPVERLPDSYLARCVVEAKVRAERIEQEAASEVAKIQSQAQERVSKLRKIFEPDPPVASQG